MDLEFAVTARRHGISERRVLEALRNTVATLPRGPMTMHLGHDSAGVPLEIGVVVGPRGAVVVHAMRMRKRWVGIYRRFLP